MEVVPNLSSSLSSIVTSLVSLPPSLLVGVSVQNLNTTFTALSNNVGPILQSLRAAQADAFLSNSTWVANNLQQLGSVIASIPTEDTATLSQEGLAELLEYGTFRYTVLTVWSPDVWGVLLVFIIAIITKLGTVVMVNRRSISLVKAHLSEPGSPISNNEAVFILTKSTKAMIAHSINLVMSTFVLCLQLSAWRLFVVPGTPMRAADGKLLTAAVKALLITFGCEMLFADVHVEIYVHHLFTFGLLFIGEIVTYHTKSEHSL